MGWMTGVLDDALGFPYAAGNEDIRAVEGLYK